MSLIASAGRKRLIASATGGELRKVSKLHPVLAAFVEAPGGPLAVTIVITLRVLNFASAAVTVLATFCRQANRYCG